MNPAAFRRYRLALLLSTALVAQPDAMAQIAADGISTLKETASTFTSVARNTIPAVVFIDVEKSTNAGLTTPFEFFGEDLLRRFFGDDYVEQWKNRQAPGQGNFLQRGQGTGFIVDKRGYIISNSHVVGEAEKITVRLHDGREFQARLVGTDAQSEVAVIKIDGPDEFPVVPLGDSSKIEIGEWVVAIGNPFGLSATLTVGVVSAKGRSNIGITDYENFIQTDAAINPGNSGGPLLNIKGEAIGINTAIYSRSGGYMGIGFAIPSNMAKVIMTQLIETGTVRRGFLGVGIQPLTSELARAFGLDPTRTRGVLIAEVVSDSPAAKAGLRKGDVVVSLNGADVQSAGAFRNAVADLPEGTQVNLEIIRDGRQEQLQVTVGAKPTQTEQPPAEEEADNSQRLGFQIQELTPELAERFGYGSAKGVIINAVSPGSRAAMAGLRAGQLITEVNRKTVSNPQEFKDALRDNPRAGVVLLLVREGEASRYVTLEVDS